MDSEEEYETKRVARVKELEEMVRKLEHENKQLLNRVSTSASTSAKASQKQGSRSARGREEEGRELQQEGYSEDPEKDVIRLSDVEEGGEDEWLFVSPKKPPTPHQKGVNPVRWLSEGHRKPKDVGIPSLEDVRKALSFHIAEAENLSMATRTQSGAESPPLRTQQPANKTAQKYLGQVRQRRLSPPSLQLPREVASSKTTENNIPLVSWRAQAMSAEMEEEEVEEVPVIKWKAKLPDENSVPIVNWKSPVPVNPAQRKTEEAVPVIKWTAQSISSPELEDDIPIVRWKKPPSQVKQPTTDDTPRVNQKPRTVVPTSTEDIPVVKWRPQAFSSPTSSLQHPSARRRPRNSPVKAIATQRQYIEREQNESSEDQLSEESYSPSDAEGGVMNGDSGLYLEERTSQEYLQKEAAQRSSRYAAHYSGGLQRPSASSHSPSTSLQYRNHPPRGLAKAVSPMGSPNLRSRSPSPSLRHPPQQQPATIRSRSPSPSLRYTGQTRQTGHSTSPLLRHSPQATRKQILPPKANQAGRSLSPASRNTTAQSHTQAPVSSPGGSPLSGSPLPARRHVSPSGSPRTTPSTPPRHSSGLPHPPPSGGRAARQLGIQAPSSGGTVPNSTMTPSPRGQSSLQRSGMRSGLTPPGGQGKQRRMLSTPPKSVGSGIRGSTPTKKQGTPQRRQVARVPPRAQEPDDDDSWLEGCF